jgi:RHS repeat-associated protein
MSGPTVLKQRQGRLEKIDGPLSGNDDTVTFDYDAFGRVRTVTDSEGYTTTTDYDALNRLTQTQYPDGSYEQALYKHLDPEWTRDRLGRWSRSHYDKLRQVVAVQDPQGLITQFDWDLDGSLCRLWDPAGNLTRWVRDIQGRVTQKIYADGKGTGYEYETRTSRLKAVTDAKLQTANYEYFGDNNLKRVFYTDDNDDPITNTPEVSYTYETWRNRLATHSDGIGTTTYGYVPINASDSVYGDGALYSIDGPWTDDTITYEYDQLGRTKKRSINGVANEVSAVFDDAGRVTSVTNNLGTFDYAYVDDTTRLDHVDLPNGQKTQFDYYDNTGDQRLKEIKHLAPNHTDVISQHNYVYNSYGQITQWVQDHDGLTDPKRYNFTYDNTDRLTAATLKNHTSGAIERRYTWGYDRAGNRISEQVDEGPGIDTVLQSASANTLNQLTGLAPSGKTVFRGTLDEPGTVTVDGNAARMSPGGTAFEGWTNLATGPNTVTVAATDESANTTTNQYEVEVAGGSTRTLTYDDNGNLLSDGVLTYEWDAMDRLLAIEKAGDWRTEFSYDGWGRRMKFADIDISGPSNIVREATLLWDGMSIQEERNSIGTNVQKRYHSLGMEVSSGSNVGEYLYLRDHLGSVTQMTDNDSSFTSRARYDFSCWGQRSANLITSGAIEVDVGYTGHFIHVASNLHFAVNRIYNSSAGRWISRDLIEEAGGVNLYVYSKNDPLNYIDPFGDNPVVIILLAAAVVGAALLIGDAALSLIPEPKLPPDPKPIGLPVPPPPPPKPEPSTERPEPLLIRCFEELGHSPKVALGVGAVGLIGSYGTMMTAGIGAGKGNPLSPYLLAWGFAAHGLAVNNIRKGVTGSGIFGRPTGSGGGGRGTRHNVY